MEEYSNNYDGTNAVEGKVFRVPLSGGTPIEVASGLTNPTDIVAESGTVYWVNECNRDQGADCGSIMKACVK